MESYKSTFSQLQEEVDKKKIANHKAIAEAINNDPQWHKNDDILIPMMRFAIKEQEDNFFFQDHDKYIINAIYDNFYKTSKTVYSAFSIGLKQQKENISFFQQHTNCVQFQVISAKSVQHLLLCIYIIVAQYKYLCNCYQDNIHCRRK